MNADGFWNNQGTINRTTSTGAANINNALENDGAINVSSGTLSLQGGDGPGPTLRNRSASERPDKAGVQDRSRKASLMSSPELL